MYKGIAFSSTTFFLYFYFSPSERLSHRWLVFGLLSYRQKFCVDGRR